MKLQKGYLLAVFGIATWGFLALLLTGEFNPAIVVGCLAMVFIALYRQFKQKPAGQLIWNVLTLMAFVGCAIMARQSLLDATVYFFMFLQIAKLFTHRSPSDARWIYVVAFFHIVAAAVLTTSVGFGLIFLVYAMLLTVSLLVFTMARENLRTEQEEARLLLRWASKGVAPAHSLPVPPAAPRFLPRALIYSSTILTFFIILGTLGFFAAIPRLSTQKLFQSYAKPQQDETSSSAFDESIEFGSFEKIQLDSSVAMYVRPLNPTIPDHIRLRGVAVDSFDGKRWRRTSSMGPTYRAPYVPFTRRVYNEHRRYMIIQPPGITNYLFGDTFPESLWMEHSQPMNYDPFSNAVWLQQALAKEFHYIVGSRIERLEERVDPIVLFPPEEEQDEDIKVQSETDRDPFMPRVMGRRLNRNFQKRLESHDGPGMHGRTSEATTRFVESELLEYIDKCLKVPTSLNAPRIRTLAANWAVGMNTTFTKAIAIENRLRSDYGYSLEVKARGNHIEDFLFRAREGHCEYFATSMAMMLRTLGIPSRVVNGYYSVEWNEIGKAFTVRQRDAHSWVEAYLGDDYGWMTFDPTPPSGVGRPVQYNAIYLAMTRLVDAMKVRWYRYIIDYSFTDQIGFIRNLLRMHNAVFAFLDGISWSTSGERTFAAYDTGSLAWIATLIFLGGGVAIVIYWYLNANRGSRKKRRKRSVTAIRFYADLLRALEKHGFRREESETPREFARKLVTIPELQLVEPVTELYYRTKYENEEPTREEMHVVEELLLSLKRLDPEVVKSNHAKAAG